MEFSTEVTPHQQFRVSNCWADVGLIWVHVMPKITLQKEKKKKSSRFARSLLVQVLSFAGCAHLPFTMASAAPVTESSPVSEDSTIATLRNILVSDDESISRRYRALFSLKSPACQHPPTERTVPAIQAMAAAMTSSSELLKHEIGYCLGQTRHAAAVEYLQREVKNPEQALMCRHEAAEALGALGDVGSLDMLRALRDDMTQHVALRETCELSVNRIEWEKSDKAQTEKLRPR